VAVAALRFAAAGMTCFVAKSRATFTLDTAFQALQPERRFIGAPENGLAAAFAQAKVAAKEIA
jgi:hypothetical protein